MQLVSVLFIAATVAGCARPPMPEEARTSVRSVVDEAVRAIGGRRAVEAARTLIIEGEGELVALGQGRTPETEPIKLRVTGLRRATDLKHGRWRLAWTLTPLFAATIPDPRTEILALDGDVPFDIDPKDGAATRVTDPDARVRRDELRHSPLALLQAALDPGATVSDRRREGGRDIVDVRTADGATFKLAVDVATGLPVTIASKTDQMPLGDVLLETEFADYKPAGDLLLPTRITSKLDRYELSVTRVTRNIVNGDVGELAAPAAVRSSPAAPPPQVEVEELASGVWLLGGETHHSALIEFADHLTLVEAPWSEARTLAVIARARQLRPSKPLTHLVVSHHHFDHSAGVRAAVSEGLAIVAHESLRAFVEELVARPHTVAPDALATRPRPLRFEPIGARAELRDGTRLVELHAVDSVHCVGMLVAYLPRERLLVEVDLYTQPRPGVTSPRYPSAGSLVELVRARNLDVERVVPLHRGIVPFATVVTAAANSAPVIRD